MLSPNRLSDWIQQLKIGRIIMMVEKEKALEIALGQIEKQFGKGAIMKLGDAGARVPVATISTGCLPLDIALGVGGIPRGRVVEICLYRCPANWPCACLARRRARRGPCVNA